MLRNKARDYEPPHIEGNPLLKSIIVGIPVIISFSFQLSLFKSTMKLRQHRKDMKIKNHWLFMLLLLTGNGILVIQKKILKRLTICISQLIDRLNLDFTHTDRSRVSGFLNLADKNMQCRTWSQHYIWQLMSQVNMMGRNANFSGKGFAENMFHVKRCLKRNSMNG